MFGLGWGEIVIILLFVLIVFGASKIPQFGDSLGKGIKNFQKSVKGESEDEKEKKNQDKDEKKS